MDGVLENYADLLPGSLNFSGPKELTQYFVNNFEIKKDRIQTKSAVTVSMTLGWQTTPSYILDNIFPTILLNIIGYSTNFFKAF